MEWRLVRTAPMNGTEVLIYCRGRSGGAQHVALWNGIEWTDGSGATLVPTHWMPLPAPPAETAAAHGPDAAGSRPDCVPSLLPGNAPPSPSSLSKLLEEALAKSQSRDWERWQASLRRPLEMPSDKPDASD